MAITDKLNRASNGTAPVPTTLSAAKAAGATTASLTLATGWPTTTAVHFVIYKVDVTGKEVVGSKTLWKATLSGTTLSNMQLKSGTEPADGYPIGSVVEPMLTSAQWDELIDALLAQHKQDGAHSDITADSLTIAAQTWASLITGWLQAPGSWSYSAWDATYKIGTITIPSDGTTRYSKGMRVRISQATGGTKYGIVVDVASTTLKVYFGTDYTLNNEAIGSPVYSHHKAPFGFPTDPRKWTVEVLDNQARAQSAPVNGTWYNLGSIVINIPIGVWDVSYQVTLGGWRTSFTATAQKVTLSTANNSESDPDLTGYTDQEGPTSVNTLRTRVYVTKTIDLVANTPYYLNAKSDNTNSEIEFRGELAKTIIRARCAYL